MTDRGSEQRRLDILTGSALGLLIGLLVSLSVSPVVGTVVGALVALIAAFFGLRPGDGGQPGNVPAAGTDHPWRIIAFSIAGLIAIALGLFIRTHDMLSPSIAAEVKRWTDAGYDVPVAQRLVALGRTGVDIAPPAGQSAAASAPPASDKSVLFDTTESSCGLLSGDAYGNTAAWIAALRTAGGLWPKVAASAAADPAHERAILEAEWTLICR